MLTKQQKELYDAFYDSSHSNESLDERTELLVGLAAAMGMNCNPCTKYYLLKAKDAGVRRGEISEVLAKVMAVAAGQKKLQAEEALNQSEITLESFL